jgi:FkbM family methyltransferase
VFVAGLLRNKRGGVFVDIGANDGVTVSNTLYFERELSWTGLAVEPIPDAFEKLRQNRQCHVLNACISDRAGQAYFVEVVGGAQMLSGLEAKLDPRHLRRIRKNLRRQGGTLRRIIVETITWHAALERFGIQSVDFLSLDTEGGELEILQSIDYNRTPVKVISVENNYFTNDIHRFLSSRGFRRLGAFGVDEIYVLRDLTGAPES